MRGRGKMIAKIKLVIWDLDETFWKGTLSEGKVEPIRKNIEAVRTMTDKGIVNSVCSKNDFSDAKKRLEADDFANVWDLIVFPSIDWTPKGERMAQLITDMNLRAENVLFIDDNQSNLQEALYYNKGLQVLDADNLNELYLYIASCDSIDISHTRLKQYKILEKKRQERQKSSSNEDFLKESDIHVWIDSECRDTARIAELITRTNQLNYTKVRISEKELKDLLDSRSYDSGAVFAKDRFGDYGMVGFYCIDKCNKRALHYLFSCRTLGMGIEQWVYQRMNYPEMNVVGPVTVALQKDRLVTWVNEDQSINEFIRASAGKKTIQNHKRKVRKQCQVLLKGPCDMFALQPFLGGIHIETEFNHVNDAGITISSHNHTSQIVEAHTLSHEKKDKILETCSFFDQSVFETNIFSDRYDVIFLSLLTDCLQGVYRNKKDGYIISISSVNWPLTDVKYMEKYNDSVNGYPLSQEFLHMFSEKFEFLGMLDVECIIKNIEYIRSNMNAATLLVLMLGSEVECEKDSDGCKGCAYRHAIVNKAVAEHFKDREDIRLINFTDFVKGQESFIDCTDHLTKDTFYKIASRMTEIINEYTGSIVKVNGEKSLGYLAARGLRKLTKIIGINNYQ